MEGKRKHSRKRDAILDCMRNTTCHPTAEWVYQQLKPIYPDLSLGTVYRNLAMFKESGTIQSIGVVGRAGAVRRPCQSPCALHLHLLRQGGGSAHGSAGAPAFWRTQGGWRRPPSQGINCSSPGSAPAVTNHQNHKIINWRNKIMKKFVCPVCGYVYEGDSIPEGFVCPQCKVPGSKFIEQKGEMSWAAEHVVGVAKDVDEEIKAGLRANFEGECSEVGMYLAMARVAHREGYPRDRPLLGEGRL